MLNETQLAWQEATLKRGARQIVLLSCSVAIACASVANLRAQSNLPATAPTTVTASQLPSANPPVPHTSPTVQWDGHLLRITASGQPLTEVFSEVAARTGMHISGNPPSDPLYGTHGPAPLFDVLSDLVGGLSVNMLFVERTTARPAQLTFTARNGAASAPNPSSAQAYAPPQQPAEQQYPGTQPFRNAGNLATSPNPGFAPSPGADPSASQPAESTTGSSNPTSPNGVKTPQEIFEQLQRLRANSGTQR